MMQTIPSGPKYPCQLTHCSHVNINLSYSTLKFIFHVYVTSTYVGNKENGYQNILKDDEANYDHLVYELRFRDTILHCKAILDRQQTGLMR